MMTFYVQIDLLNSAVQNSNDIAGILRDLADKLEIDSDVNDSNFYVDIKLRDLNGNTVGKAYTA